MEVQIADDGEILVRGSGVMTGYFHMPRETEEALRDGWFHTGDIGRLDQDGYLTITDRKKDLIVTSNGKNVAPQALESRLKLVPYFENVVVLGDRRNFISALVTPNYEALAEYARAKGIRFDDPTELVNSPEIYKAVMREVERKTADLASFEKVKKIAFVDREFELTPTLKVKRGEVEKRYQVDIERLYAA
jgi:long-chain acyl-CoA synthetase